MRLIFDEMELDESAIADLLRVDIDGWLQEIPMIKDYYKMFGSRVPDEMNKEISRLQIKLEAAKKAAA